MAALQPSKPKPETKSGSGLRRAKPAKSLFSVQNGQSLRSQLDDAALILRWIIRSARASQSPVTFFHHFVIRPTFKNDMFVISFGLPALSGTPRVLDDAPAVRSSASTWTYHGERTAAARTNLVNAASYNYLGYVNLEHNTRKLLQYAIQSLPLADNGHGSNTALEDELKDELRRFMRMPGCVLTASGYAINLVAFPAMATFTLPRIPSTTRHHTVYLMDSESHSSMFMGAYIACASSSASIIKFRHNDVCDLADKLETIYADQSQSSQSAPKNVWVTVEGLYSMDGTVAPLVEIIELKRKYGFRIYVDEAHSFLSLGKAGRGSLEYFMDRKMSEGLSATDVDMLGGTLSKALASVGGFVLSSREMEAHIERRIDVMRDSGEPPIPTLSLIRTLQILKKPDVVSQRLSRLRSVSAHVAEVLTCKGYHISTTEDGPFIAIIFDTVNRVLEFLRVGRERGLICCGAAYPAAPRGAPRIRLSLTSAHSWEDISEMLGLVDQISIQVGVKGLKLPGKLNAATVVPAKEAALQSPSQSSLEEVDANECSDQVDASILRMCPAAVEQDDVDSTAIRQAGAAALSKYNLGASGPRWMYGTFSVHMSLESRINLQIEQMLRPVVKSKRSLEEIQTTLFTDARIGIMSIIAVAMEGLALRRSKKGERHLVLLPNASGLEIREGAAAAQRDRSTLTRWYDLAGKVDSSTETQTTEHILSTECNDDSRFHVTIFIDVGLLHECTQVGDCQATMKDALLQILSPLSLLAGSTTRKSLTTTVLIRDECMFSSKYMSTRRILDVLSELFPDMHTSSKLRFLFYSSFAQLPHLPGLQGAFCTGSKHLIEKIQFLGPGVMYTAMMPPTTAVLAEESIRRIID